VDAVGKRRGCLRLRHAHGSRGQQNR